MNEPYRSPGHSRWQQARQLARKAAERDLLASLALGKRDNVLPSLIGVAMILSGSMILALHGYSDWTDCVPLVAGTGYIAYFIRRARADEAVRRAGRRGLSVLRALHRWDEWP